jgi:hypothetical protein
MRDGYLRGALSPQATQRQMDVLAAHVAAGGSVQDAARARGHPAEHSEAPPRRPACAVRPDDRAADLRGRASGRLVVLSLEPRQGGLS